MKGAVTVLNGRWLTSKQASAVLNRDIRTVQKMAAAGVLKWKPVDDGSHARLYDPEDLDRYLKGQAPQGMSPRLLKEAKTQAVEKRPSQAIAVRPAKPSQSERALDTVSIVGQIMVSHKAELQTLVDLHTRSLETVVNLILTAQRAEADANRERQKAEREDARERWEIERRERLERRMGRTMTAKAGG